MLLSFGSILTWDDRCCAAPHIFLRIETRNSPKWWEHRPGKALFEPPIIHWVFPGRFSHQPTQFTGTRFGDFFSHRVRFHSPRWLRHYFENPTIWRWWASPSTSDMIIVSRETINGLGTQFTNRSIVLSPRWMERAKLMRSNPVQEVLELSNHRSGTYIYIYIHFKTYIYIYTHTVVQLLLWSDGCINGWKVLVDRYTDK